MVNDQSTSQLCAEAGLEAWMVDRWAGAGILWPAGGPGVGYQWTPREARVAVAVAAAHRAGHGTGALRTIAEMLRAGETRRDLPGLSILVAPNAAELDAALDAPVVAVVAEAL